MKIMSEQKFGLFVAWMLWGGQVPSRSQSLLEMEGHMMRKQEDEVWNFGGTQSC